MRGYSHKAKHTNSKGILVSSSLSVLAIFSLALAVKSDNLSSVLHICAIILFIFALTFISRFILTGYEYFSDGQIFSVTEFRMKTRRVRVRLYLSEIDELIPVSRRKDAKAGKRPLRVFDYRTDLLPKKYCILVLRSDNFCDNGEELRILIQPDERMLQILKGSSGI